jgi:hypothetical protein
MAAGPEVYNRPFTWSSVLSVVEDRLGMWVSRPTYERAIALVTGFDMAQAESIHDKMQQLVIERHNSGSLGWPFVLMAQATGGDIHVPRDLGPLTPEEDALAIAQLVADLRLVLGIEPNS